MFSYTFQAFGTHWAILTDGSKLPDALKNEIYEKTIAFEKRFSRFQKGSEVLQFRNSPAGTYTISEDLLKLLIVHQELKDLTNGLFDPAVGELLEKAGYDENYSFSPKNLEKYALPEWSISGKKIRISGPIVFDFGGIGKGYWIDQISKILQENNQKNYLIDGGRDLFATQKTDGSGWKIAIEWPGKQGIAVGTVVLKNQGLAASDTILRSWKNWHHLIDLSTKTPQTNNIGSTAIAKSALTADMMTSVLSFCSKEKAKEISQKFDSEYIVFNQNNTLITSTRWSGELFTK